MLPILFRKKVSFTRTNYTSSLEELLNVVSHIIGVFIAVFGTYDLLIIGKKTSQLLQIGLGIYGVSTILMYSSSAIYHIFKLSRHRHIFRVIDHSAIYIIFAGFYTPFFLLLFEGWIAVVILSILWISILIGIGTKIFHFEKVSIAIAIYIFIIALGFVRIQLLPSHITNYGILLLFTGGGLYAIGLLFYLWKNLYFNHVIWHLFIIAATICHFNAMRYLY